LLFEGLPIPIFTTGHFFEKFFFTKMISFINLHKFSWLINKGSAHGGKYSSL
jgi:hypothetical protein